MVPKTRISTSAIPSLGRISPDTGNTPAITAARMSTIMIAFAIKTRTISSLACTSVSWNSPSSSYISLIRSKNAPNRVFI